MIYVTNDLKLRIVDPVVDGEQSDTQSQQTSSTFRKIAKNDIRREVSLASKVGVSSGRRPVALQVGYTTPLVQGYRQMPTQMVVVVTEDWGILAFDHLLRPLWESYVVGEIPKNNYHSEVTIAIVPMGVENGDQGVVVIGGRLEPIPNEMHRSPEIPAIGLDINKAMAKENTLDEGEPDDDDDHTHGNKANDHGDDDAHKDESHFSYFALNALDGKLRWKHTEESFMPDNPHAHEKNEKRHSYRQHLFSLLDHVGEVNWKVYKQSMLASMPHRWSSNFDTKFDVRHFEKGSSSVKHGAADTEHDEWNTEVVGVHPSHLDNIVGASILSPHAEADHVVEPNVIVAHTKNGLEAIQIHSGRTVCKMILDNTDHYQNSDHYIVYTDLNGDGMVDQVHAMAGDFPGASQFSRSRRPEICLGMAMTGLPPRDYLFNRSICNQNGVDFDYFFWRSVPGGANDAGGALNGIQTVAPAIIAHPATPNSKEIVFLVSSGKITSVRFNGAQNWARDTDARWSKRGQPYPHPSIQGFSIDAYGAKTHILAVAESLVILTQQGDVMISEKLGGKRSSSPMSTERTDMAAVSVIPMGPPVIGDLNNDGYNDIIVPTVHGYYVYLMEHGHQTTVLTYFSVLFTSAFLFIVFKTRDTGSSSTSSSSQGTAVVGKLFGKSSGGGNTISSRLSGHYKKDQDR
ncbi:hypothetical protein SAMD00019534_089870 [Acytostelium subglobosum LB1]|uniref:hypothetical protein n=1 Tax=Acytostelium subglobosum LB1 TaxID=1410327 RepID=UPI0006448754|nr:hypothetical protein SAMD00019534_089870 [Acytostelium subglobosum LB1]GAM25812.1 hypothetical protein SAMD00019534_089870 [Acytostelium subglobosum LB1]|eukprot:XP_012751330.1 hypothetical protein SAMD00019534_089870 [Acytostelium subglobosum LB1]